MDLPLDWNGKMRGSQHRMRANHKYTHKKNKHTNRFLSLFWREKTAQVSSPGAGALIKIRVYQKNFRLLVVENQCDVLIKSID